MSKPRCEASDRLMGLQHPLTRYVRKALVKRIAFQVKNPHFTHRPENRVLREDGQPQ
jgi:hypothetical protein